MVVKNLVSVWTFFYTGALTEVYKSKPRLKMSLNRVFDKMDRVFVNLHSFFI